MVRLFKSTRSFYKCGCPDSYRDAKPRACCYKFYRNAVERKRKANNKKHEVWELSFDWKHCSSDKFIQQKMDYIHSNPCKGKWNLCASPEHYKHSSVKYYLKEAQGFYKIDNVGEMSDKVFVQSVDTIMIDETSGKCPDFAEK